MKKYIFALIASVMATMVSAQTITIQEEREFYQKVYKLFNDYAQSAAVSDDEEEAAFRNLFVNGELEIQNDLMNLSREPKLTVDEYIETIQKARSVKVLVKNIKKDGEVEDDGETWSLPVVFEKGISFSKDGAFFDSYDYFGGYYRLRAVVSLNKSSGECYMTELGVDPKHDWLVFPEKFAVLERTPEEENKRNFKRDDKLTIDGRDVHWNRYNQVLLRPGQEQKIRYNDNAVDIKEMSKMSNGGSKIRAYYSDKSWRIRLNGGYSVNLNSIENAQSVELSEKESGLSYGLDLGYVFPSTSKWYLGLFAGVNLSPNGLTLKSTPGTVELSCSAEQDEDGDSYTRKYQVNGDVTQTLKATDMAFSLYLDLEYQLRPRLSAYFDFGAKILMASGDWSANISSYEVSGKYDTYNVEIKGGPKGKETNLNGFGEWDGGEMSVTNAGMDSKTALCLLAGFGFRYNLGKSPFAIDLGFQYSGLGKSWEITSSKANEKDKIFDFVLDKNQTEPQAKAKGDKVNLLRETDGIKHSAFRVSLGLIYKF